jgi:hypothetical protein
MKQQQKWFAVLAVAGGLVMAGLAQAQPVTTDTYLDNIPASGAGSPSYTGFWTTGNGAVWTSTPTGLEVNALGGPGTFSTLYYPIPGPDQAPINPLDTQVTFQFTWNSGNAVGGVNVLFALDDNNGGVNYYGTGYVVPTPGLNSYTFALQSPNQANVAAGYSIGGINFQIDPANVAGTYDMTFNSLTLSPVPEPTTLALAGLGAIGLLAVRRRK